MSVLKLRKTPLNLELSEDADFQPKVLCSSQIDRKQKKLEKRSLIKFNVCSTGSSKVKTVVSYIEDTSRRYSLLAN